MNEDKSFICNGSDIKWILPNNTEINESSKNYQITASEDESILTVKIVDIMKLGLYKCNSHINDTFFEKLFHLKLYCVTI